MKIFNIKPIGRISSPYKYKKNIPRQGDINEKIISEIEIFDDFLQGISTLKVGDEVFLLFYFDKSDHIDLQLTPPNCSEIRGVFSTRTPNRPNHIGLTKVKIIDISQNKIKFIGGDMLDGTPLLDIKPFF